MQRNIEFSEGEYYHVYSRGVDKRDIFLDNRDRERFQRLLYLANGEKSYKYSDLHDLALTEIECGKPLVAIGAYCLMPNHFHLLVKEIKENGISEFMKKLGTGYSMYFNKRNKRTGALFESRFKARHADRDEYLKYLYSYIHLNPIKLIEPDWKESGIKDRTGAKKYLEQYAYSSFPEYAGIKRPQGAIINPREFPGYFSTKLEFRRMISDWLNFQDEELSA